MALLSSVAVPLACKPPVVHEGRYVELATDRTEPICGGTVAYMDDYVSAVASLLGETLPERNFIRYEWSDEEWSDEYNGLTTRRRNHSLIESHELVSEHELVHAVHFQVWPGTRRFLHEGLATLLGSAGYLRSPWPEGKPLDPLLEAEEKEDVDYHDALFVVSQIVRDHGFDGLRELWHRVPRDASARQIRDTYEAIFDRPIEALFEPVDGVPRHSCHFTVCVGEPADWNGDEVALPGPSDCEDDPRAVGPMSSRYLGTVWRPHVVDLEDAPLHWESVGGVGAYLRWCRLRCDPGDPHAEGGVAPDGSSTMNLGPGPMRVEVSQDLEELPLDEPGVVRISAEP